MNLRLLIWIINVSVFIFQTDCFSICDVVETWEDDDHGGGGGEVQIRTTFLLNPPKRQIRLVLSSSLSYEICKETVHTYQADAINVLNSTNLTAVQMCKMSMLCQSDIDDPDYDWNITIPKKDNTRNALTNLSSTKPSLKQYRILHLTDAHVQLNYVPGSNAQCNKPLCCDGHIINDSSKQAGYFGDYRKCDLPVWTLEEIFKHISKNEKFDFVYWTGDAPSHDVWNQTKSGNLYAIRTVSRLLKKYFAKKNVYSAVGNHESQPCNLFPSTSVLPNGTTWLYSNISADWVNLGKIHTTDNFESLNRGGYYTTLLTPKLRLIALNSNYCSKENYWLYVNPVDPENQLTWLIKWLEHAETQGEKVHIISHHFPSACLKSWSFNYYRIVKRFQNVIAGQFFGHEHYDDLRIFMDDENRSHPFAVAYLSPSLTSYPNLNPGYRIYTISGDSSDCDSFTALDHETTILDLNASNRLGKCVFQKEYSMLDAYALKSLKPQEILNFVRDMQTNPNGENMEKFLRYRYKSNVEGKCDLKCKRAILCDILKSRTGDNSNCNLFSSVRKTKHSNEIVLIILILLTLFYSRLYFLNLYFVMSSLNFPFSKRNIFLR